MSTRHEIVSMGGFADWMSKELVEAYTVHDLSTAPDRAAMLAAAAGVTAVVTNGGTGIDGATIERLPKLKLVSNFGIGYDKVDLPALKRRGATLTNTPGVVERCVADHAIGLMIALTRKIALAARLGHAGVWDKSPIGLTRRVSGSKLGILGMGAIGAEIAKRASGFDMAIGYHNRRKRGDTEHRYFPSLIELAAWADHLVIACPGGAETRHMVDRAVLEALGTKGAVINIARGTIVDEAALASALRSGKLGGAALDVFDVEPGYPAGLVGLDNVVLTPHIAGSTQETWREAFDITLANLAAHFAGKELLTPVKF
ncbi:MAG: 2-hydroxyacid dehydrogenase [Alphaproteobacteria bacterium]|nr:2-hydroxyacid dehydrogenase [Alphaproteobacteria bacterium]